MIIGGGLINIGQLPYNLGGSLRLNGSSQYLTLAIGGNGTSLDLSSATFTLEAWIYVTSTASRLDISGASATTTSGNSTIDWVLWMEAGGAISFAGISGSSNITVTGAVISANTWYHVAVTRIGTVATVWVNGQGYGGGASTAYASFNTNNSIFGVGNMGSYNGLVRSWNGYIANFRLIKGTAIYTSNFSVPTTPLTNITNTVLLLSVANSAAYITDSSSSPLTVTNVNATTYNSLTPFQVPIMNIGSTPSSAPPTIEYLVVAGGGGGTGVASGNAVPGGGGGAGGVVYQAAFPVSSGFLYIITVGGGGAAVSVGAACNAVGTVGNDSSINSLVVAKGGGGSGYYTTGTTGGSGGGGGYNGSAGGGSNQSSAGVIPSGAIGYGNAGGAGGGIGSGGGGGGGASSAGSASPQAGGVGGVGTATTIISTSTAQSLNVGQVSGAFVYFAGGGAGGGAYNATTTITAGPLGGGGAGGNTTTAAGSGINYTGGGGGSAPNTIAGGKGGSGVIIIRYPNTYSNAASTTGVGVNLVNANGYITYIFTSSGSITF
jgi:Concanavalin A-like lectin/glucanases superfamily